MINHWLFYGIAVTLMNSCFKISAIPFEVNGDDLAFLNADNMEGRSIGTGRKESNRCRGSITNLKKDEATVFKSHYGYGSDPYPDNYQCRWLFTPDDCNLGIECAMKTEFNQRRGRTLDKCLGGDYLRLLGYRGTLDNFYCGERSFNVSFAGSDSVAVVFRSTRRDDTMNDDLQRQGFLSDLFKGFSCKVVCRNPKAISGEATTDKIKSTTTTEATTSTASPTVVDVDVSEVSTLNCRCGETRQGRIVCPSGHNCTASPGSIPWQAAIVHKSRSQPWCGGSVINNRYVLTAGHCLKGKKAESIQVILGEHDWTTKEESFDQRYDVDEIIMHPNFGNRAQFDYDFALVKLHRTIDFDFHVRPVCLPFGDQDEGELIGRIADVSGWGVVNPKRPQRQARHLQTVQVKVMNDEECTDMYSSNLVTDTMMCAAAPDRDACFGDSGGPMTMSPTDGSRGPAILEGVISWGKNCAKPEYPGVYARVRMVLDWIVSNTRDARFCEIRQKSRKADERDLKFNTEVLFL